LTARALNLRRTNAGVMLKVRLTPKSGRANAALERLVADWLRVPPSSVAVVQGGKSRLKQVEIQGDADALTRLIAARVTELAK
jgi:uncharacterized protein YggU (UPF0235/DUF167 family)